MVEPSQRRLILAAKVGIATMLTTLLTLLDGVYAFNELGAWATITVVITMQPTVGSTTNKGIQRCLGTVFAAALMPDGHSVLTAGADKKVICHDRL